jgi:serine/threonine protein kinase
MSDTGHLKCPRCGKELTASAPEGLCPSCLGALNFATDTAFTDADAQQALPPLTPAELAPHFPQLEILECLGRGGMGVVYKARQKSLNRLVALKLLAPERVQDAKFAERFAREAHALAALNHPRIVTVHDFGQAGGYYFLLMEFVDGVNLRQLLRSRKLQSAEALAIVPPICEALQYAHEHGIVHRDIKPENLLLAKDGRVKIADFGIAKMLGSAASAASFSLSSGGEGQGEETPGSSATQQTTMGTPQYMAPEQREQPQAADHRADIYSLGVVLYELLTGELPADKLQPPSRVRGVHIDVRLDEIVLRALEKTPELRYQTAGEFKTQVETVAGAASSPPPLGAKTQPLLKAGRCYLTTREKLGTLQGQMFLYRDRYELVLDDRQLAFLAMNETTTIPLASIRDLSLGRFPAAVNPAGLDFISVTYEEGGQKRELIFAPNESLFGAPANFNEHVGEWFKAIRNAIQAATGKLPGNTPMEPLPDASKAAFLARYGMYLVYVLIGVTLSAGLMSLSSRGLESPGAWRMMLVIVTVGFGLLGVMGISRFKSVIGSGTGSGRRHTTLGLHVGTVTFYAGVILGILLIGMLSFRFSRDSAYLLVVGIMVLVSPFVGVMTGNALRQAEQGNDQSGLERIKGRLKALSIIAWILAVPVVGFAVFFFMAMLDERGKWNPATSEAVIVPLTWLGAILLPWAALRLAEVAKEESTPVAGMKRPGTKLFGALCLLLTVIWMPLTIVQEKHWSAEAARLKYKADQVIHQSWLHTGRLSSEAKGTQAQALAIINSFHSSPEAKSQAKLDLEAYQQTLRELGRVQIQSEQLKRLLEGNIPAFNPYLYGVLLAAPLGLLGLILLRTGDAEENHRGTQSRLILIGTCCVLLMLSLAQWGHHHGEQANWMFQMERAFQRAEMNLQPLLADRKPKAKGSFAFNISWKDVDAQGFVFLDLERNVKLHPPMAVRFAEPGILEQPPLVANWLKANGVDLVVWFSRSKFEGFSAKALASGLNLQASTAVDKVIFGELERDSESERWRLLGQGQTFLYQNSLDRKQGPTYWLIRTATGNAVTLEVSSSEENDGQLSVRYTLWETRQAGGVKAVGFSPQQASTMQSTTVQVPTKFAFPVWLILGVLLLGGLFIGGLVLMVWLARKNGLKGCLFAGVVVGGLILVVGIVAVVVFWSYSVKEIRQGFQPISTLVLSSINPNSPPATPNGLAMQVQNGFNLNVPPGQLVTFEVFIRHGDDRREPVPALTAVVATDEGDGINTWLSWMGKREDDGQGTNQLWSWSVNGNVLGAVPMPNRTDYGTNMAWHVKSREVLNWWQLALPKSLTMNAGSIQEIALFRTFGSATTDPAQPKEIIARIKRHAIPEEMKMQVGQYQMLLGLEAFEKVDAWNQKAGIGVKRTLETGKPLVADSVSMPLVSKEMVEQARKDYEIAKLLMEAGRATSGEAVDAETHLKWAEAMHKGDVRSALEAKRDGVAKKYERVKLLAGDRLPRSELAKAARELAEAEAALKQFDLKEAK